MYAVAATHAEAYCHLLQLLCTAVPHRDDMHESTLSVSNNPNQRQKVQDHNWTQQVPPKIKLQSAKDGPAYRVLAHPLQWEAASAVYCCTTDIDILICSLSICLEDNVPARVQLFCQAPPLNVLYVPSRHA